MSYKLCMISVYPLGNPYIYIGQSEKMRGECGREKLSEQKLMKEYTVSKRRERKQEKDRERQIEIYARFLVNISYFLCLKLR